MSKNTTVEVSESLYKSVLQVISRARQFISRVANGALVETYWQIGRLIVEDEQKGCRKAEYGKGVLKELSVRLTSEFGSGFDASNLRNMRGFYLAFPICDALRHELGWTHYRILMREQDPVAREWYMNECVACGWSSRNLDGRL